MVLSLPISLSLFKGTQHNYPGAAARSVCCDGPRVRALALQQLPSIRIKNAIFL